MQTGLATNFMRSHYLNTDLVEMLSFFIFNKN